MWTIGALALSALAAPVAYSRVHTSGHCQRRDRSTPQDPHLLLGELLVGERPSFVQVGASGSRHYRAPLVLV